jgi:YVTN family beta-propeller protein
MIVFGLGPADLEDAAMNRAPRGSRRAARRPFLLPLALLPVLAVACEHAPVPSGPVATPSNPLVCSPEDVSPDALGKAGIAPDGHTAVLSNGRAITPAGTRFATADFPLGLAIDAAGTRAYVLHTGEAGNTLMVFDLTQGPPALAPSLAPAGARLQTLGLGVGFKGVALTPDGGRLLVGNGARLWFYDVQPDGRLAEPGRFIELNGFIADVAVAPDGAHAYAVANTNSKVFEIVLADESLARVLQTGGALPYDLAIAPDGTRLWASNLSASTVTAIDLATGALVADIPVGKGPEGLAMSADGTRLYVASADADEVAEIDTATATVLRRFDLSGDPRQFKHGNVNGIALSPDGATLYASAAAMSAVFAVDIASGQVLGAVPTGWYATEVVAHANGLYVVSSKGMGNPNKRGLKTIPGFVAALPWPDATALQQGAAQVDANNRRGSTFFTGSCDPETVPVLQGPEKSPIKHVVLIVRENKTYDMVLGDLTDAEGNPIGDGDPAMVVFGEQYTPNFHKMSREFTTLDNYYANAEVSLQGHQWVTQAQCNDLMEKSHLDQLAIPGIDDALIPDGPTPTIFDLCFEHGVSFRNYGEFPSFGLRFLEEYAAYYDPKYPFWTMGVWDVDKAAEAIREWELGIFPQFIFLLLPNDHTYGSRAGFPTPATMVADNDLGTAMVIEWISNSEHWPETAVFIIEDDPQGTGDHVDPHRSLCTVVSPWVRRGYISSVHYDIPSLYRTIELILGLPPMGKNDAYAPPMVDIWVDGEAQAPDMTPYDAVPVDVPYEVNPVGAPMQAESAGCGDRGLDGCPGLGTILWRVMKGDVPMPPQARFIDD